MCVLERKREAEKACIFDITFLGVKIKTYRYRSDKFKDIESDK